MRTLCVLLLLLGGASAQAAEITIDRVVIANPIVVTGRARTFENSVSLRVRDARGKVIAEDFTTSRGEIGHRNPYRGTIWLTSDPGSRVTIEVLEYSAKDGSERSLVKVTRKFRVPIINARLHLATADCNGTAVTRRRIPKSVTPARLHTEALLRIPTTNPFPRGARVESVILRKGVLTVDFNDALRNVGGACRAQMIRQMVTKTLMALPNVKRVVITAAGSEKLALQP